MFIWSSRTIAVAKLVEELKVSSSKWLKTQSPELAGFAWQRGYGAFSVGPSDLEALRHYIDTQPRSGAMPQAGIYRAFGPAGKIGTYAKLVDDRNDTAHPKRQHLLQHSSGARRQDHRNPPRRRGDTEPLQHCYRDFLLQNHDPDEREYPDAADQIREVLIHGNYLSQNGG